MLVILNCYLNYPFFYKEPKNLTNIQLSKELPFFSEKSKRPKGPKRLTKHQILQNVLPFYDTVGISRREHAHKYYAETYDVEVIDNTSLDDSLFLAKSSLDNLFRDLLREKWGFKYNLVAIVTLKRWNNAINRYDIETKHIKAKAITVTNQRLTLNSACEELKDRLDIWNGLGSGWIIDKIEHINYDPLAGSSYITLPPGLNHPVKGLINLKNKDHEFFKWCHIRFINPQNKDWDRIKKQDKKIAETLDYRGINFPMKARDYEIVLMYNINVNVFGHENKVFLLCVSKHSNEQVLNVLLISNEEKSHYVFIKDFNRLMYSKTKHKDKKPFCMSCLQNFSTKEILNSHRERCLLINETQAVKYETGIIKFKSFNKQIPIPFKIWADSECLLKRININKGGYTKLYQKHIPNFIGAKLVCIDNKFTLPTKIFTGINSIKEFIEWIFEQQKYCNQIINKHFNKKIKMTIKDENNYQNSQNCWICNEKINKDKDKVRDHCHITGKYRGDAHKKCNSELRTPRKLPIIFHNLEGYDGHLIFRELNNFKDIDIQVIPKTNERYMSIIVNNSIVFLDSLQFCKASLDSLAGNLEDNDFKHLMSEFSKDKLEILKRKDAYPYKW